MAIMETAVILAGGDSKRIGYPKSLLKLQGYTLIEILVNRLKDSFQELILVTDRPELYHYLPVIIAGDVYTSVGKSSLRGIHAGLSAATHPTSFVVACDMPFVNIKLVKLLHGYAGEAQAVVPKIGEYYQPLFAVYKKSCIDAIEECLGANVFKVIDFYKHIKVKYIDEAQVEKVDPGQYSFFNVNTPEDYQYAKKIFKNN